jgi:hypothetical protein
LCSGPHLQCRLQLLQLRAGPQLRPSLVFSWRYLCSMPLSGQLRTMRLGQQLQMLNLQEQFLHRYCWRVQWLQLQLHFLQEQHCLHRLCTRVHPNGGLQRRHLPLVQNSLRCLPVFPRLLHLLRQRIHQEGLEVQEQHLHRLQIRPPGYSLRRHGLDRCHCSRHPPDLERKLNQHRGSHLRNHLFWFHCYEWNRLHLGQHLRGLRFGHPRRRTCSRHPRSGHVSFWCGDHCIRRDDPLD